MKTQTMIDRTSDMLSDRADALADHADDLMKQGVRALAQGSEQVRDRALAVGDVAADYIRREPVTAVLIAAVAGAVLVGLAGLLSRSRR